MISACYYFVVVTLLLYVSPLSAADSIQGCGGFVEASTTVLKSRKPSDAKFDYSHITVELRTLDGLVKDRTQCAPNGYYFIPVYNKGSFLIKIKGPEGWSCTPEQVPVVVDHTGCNANDDINFWFTGFTLSGRVVGAVCGDSCSHKNGGPSNVNVELLSPSGDVVSSVSTSSGSYSFKNIIPGNYKIRASRSNLKIEVKGSEEVELGFDNGVVDDIFFASGYDIRGSVVAQGNPIVGVHFYLYSDHVLEVDCPHDSGNAPGLGKALCHAVSDADGMFTFKFIPCGIYKLLPFYKGENTVFDISPSSMLVSVQHDHAIIPQKFQVTGFSVGGRVVDSNGIGVDGAKIVVDGHERSITDEEGYYKLDRVTSKRYSIEAKKEHHKFERLNDFLVLPDMASVVDIKAISYDICGVAQTVSSDHKAKVALTHGPENVKPQVKHTDESGNFCFEAPPGEYRISALAATPESAQELLFTPAYIDVIVNKPLLSISFNQAQVNVRGLVVCRRRCGSSVSVMLVRLDGKSKEERRKITLTKESSEFCFSNVLPGKYRVEVKYHSPHVKSGEDIWCWAQSFVNVDVGAEDVEGIVFIRKGNWVRMISSYDVDAYLIAPDGSRVNLTIKKGSQQICVESAGFHELHFTDSCFAINFLLKRTNMYLPSVNLTIEKYPLKGHIHVESNKNLPENIPLDILGSEGTVIGVTYAQLVSNETDQQAACLNYRERAQLVSTETDQPASYEYCVGAKFGEKLIVIPRDLRSDGGKKILFYPRQQHASVAKEGRQVLIAPFSGRLGLYIEGSVSPPLSHVHIRVLAEKDSQNTPLKQGDVALESTTGTDGLFLAGPLYDDIGYTVVASKPGYYVKQVGPYTFSWQKLGQILVRLYFGEDSNEPSPSVLLSLSGKDGYRNNSVTGIGGTFVFDNLFPGSFYLRPLLKEYAFSPPAEAIDLGSGESKEVAFHATRIAFSALGKVTLLSGQPKEGALGKANEEQSFDIPISTSVPTSEHELHDYAQINTTAMNPTADLVIGQTQGDNTVGSVSSGLFLDPPLNSSRVQPITQSFSDFLFADTTIMTTSIEAGTSSRGRTEHRSGRRTRISASGKEFSVSPNAMESPRQLDDRCILEQIKDITESESPRHDKIPLDSVLPDSCEPDALPWDLGISIILPGELKKHEDTSSLRLVQSLFKLFEQGKYYALQLGAQNDEMWFGKDSMRHRLDVEVAKTDRLTLQNQLLEDDIQKLRDEKLALQRERDDLAQLNANFERSRQGAFDEGYDQGYQKRQEELVAFLDMPTPGKSASSSRPTGPDQP